jgi:subtilisin family serine protease
MRKFLLLIITFYSCLQSLNAQVNHFYYYKGQKIYLTLDKTKLSIITNSEFQKNSISNLSIKDFNLYTSENLKYSEIEFVTEPSHLEFYQKFNAIKSNPNINHVNLFFKRGDSISSIGISNIFYVKLKSSADFSLLQERGNEKGAIIEKQIPFMPHWYQLKLNPNSVENTLTITSELWETGLFEDIDPGFLFDFNNNQNTQNNTSSSSTQTSCSNDTNFSSLWGLNNSTNPNIDINACQAWNVSQGNGIKVAVVDGSGIELTHNDLASNIFPLSFNMEIGSSPSQVTPDDPHSTHIAGTIAAIKDNNLQVVGVAPQSKIMSVSHSGLLLPSMAAGQFASGINWAWQNGADVINCSWGDQNGAFYSTFHSTILENAILDAMSLGRSGKGSIVVFASGNNGGIDYPGNFHPEIITVGAINQNGQRAIFSPSQQSAYGTKLDVVAPGFQIRSTTLNNTISFLNGTSMAAPHVAGIAALILSVNPCLTQQQVATIIESTSQKVGGYTYSTNANRPNGIWNNEVGYGLVDAYASVVMAQQMNNATLDLMVKDGIDDVGDEPNNITPYMWASTDIWIRNQPDGIEEHQNPEYSSTIPNYAYVRVTNKNCVASTGNELLKLYWAKAGTSLEWPNTWDGNNYFPTPNNTKLLGAPIGTATIPVLQAGQETILQIPFPVPNPNDYSFAGSDQWHFCLLARIEAINDPLNETNNLYANVQNNNGIAWKNISIVDLVANVTNGTIAVGNPFDEPHIFFLELIKEDLETGQPIYDEAEVTIKMDDVLYNAWVRGGKLAQQVDPTLEEKSKIVKGNNVLINNIAFNPNEIGILDLNFNFLTEELTEKSKFVYHVIQKDAQTGEIIGGETFVIKKEIRPVFIADAGGDKDVDINEPITMCATEISEPAIYNWYDTEGNLIFTGKDLTIATQVATKYKLEVIATTDGFKDYSEVDVNLKPSTLNTITPNPASNNVTISYKLNEVNSAYLMILGSYGTTNSSNNYVLDLNSSETNINISNYPNGFYTVALICNGQIIDAKTLVKQ